MSVMYGQCWAEEPEEFSTTGMANEFSIDSVKAWCEENGAQQLEGPPKLVPSMYGWRDCVALLYPVRKVVTS